MLTAKTLQLLDANNNNVSPAVCVESLYYEMHVGNSTDVYRMSMKNRTLIAGNSLANATSTPTPENIPYYTVNKLSTGNNIIYELNAGSYNLWSDGGLNEYIENKLDSYYTSVQVDNLFLSRNNGGVIYGEEPQISIINSKVDTDNANSLILKADDEKFYILFGENASLYSTLEGVCTLNAAESININTNVVTFNSDVDFISDEINIDSETLNINSDTVDFSGTDYNVDATNINLNGTNINLQGSIKLGDITWNVQVPEEDYIERYNVLEIDKDGKMSTSPLPALYVYKSDSSIPSVNYLTTNMSSDMYIANFNYHNGVNNNKIGLVSN